MQENNKKFNNHKKSYREKNLCDIYADYESIYCDIKVMNTMYFQEAYHKRVPKLHVDWISIAPHLKVKIIRKYKVDNGYYKNNSRNYNQKNNKGRSN